MSKNCLFIEKVVIYLWLRRTQPPLPNTLHIMNIDSILSRFTSSFTPTERKGSESVSGHVNGVEASLRIYSELNLFGMGPITARVMVNLQYGSFHYCDMVSPEQARVVYSFIRGAIDEVMTEEMDSREADEIAFNSLFTK